MFAINSEPTTAAFVLYFILTKKINILLAYQSGFTFRKSVNNNKLNIGIYQFPFQQINPFLHLLLSVCIKEKRSIWENYAETKTQYKYILFFCFWCDIVEEGGLTDLLFRWI